MEAQKRVSPVRRIDEPRNTEKKKDRDYYIDKVVSGSRSERTNFERPKHSNSTPLKNIGIFVSSLVFFAVAFFVWHNLDNDSSGQIAGVSEEKLEKWYSVRVSTGESFYGQAIDLSSDPVELRNVYYDYDRLLGKGRDEEVQSATSSLRLVKRGKETHGPDGTMEIVRSQIIYFEPLKDDSKVLKAILENEKK